MSILLRSLLDGRDGAKLALALSPPGVPVPFPLPLTPFERYYLTDDRPQYPTTIPVELLLSGRLEQEPFRTALRQVVARHPLLNALIEDVPSGPQWIARDDADPLIDWGDESRPITDADGEYLDLRHQPGFRVWVRVGNENSRIVMQFHHACCDGLAVLQVVGDLMVFYATAVGGSESVPALPTLPVERLRDRGLFDTGSAAKPSLLAALRDVFVTLGVWWRIVFGRCRVLAGAGRSSSDKPRASDPSEFLTFETHVLPRDASERLKQVAKSRGATLNDLLLRDMLLVARDWNRAHGDVRGGPLRINVPVYVRGRLRRDIPASNGIGFAFVTINPEKFADADALLDEVRQQTRRIKNWKLALYFLGGLAMGAGFPRVMRWVLGRNKPLATVVLSYLGPAVANVKLPRRDGKLVSGDVVLEQMAGVPPVRPLTRASMVVLEYAKELTFALRTDARYFRPDDTRALLDAYVARLSQSAATE